MQKQTRIITISALTKAALAAAKYALAWMSGSIALAADATHSLCDVVPTAGILACLFFSERKSRRFPHGLHKIENLVSLFVALAIFYAGYEIMHDAATDASREPLAGPLLALAGALLGAVVMWVLARYEEAVGRETGSPSVKADAQHNKVDVFSSLLVGAGVAAGFAGFQIDWLAALCIAVLVFGVGIKIFIESVTVLLDGSLDETTLQRARDIMLSQSEVTSVGAVSGRSSGSYKILEAVLEISTRDLAVAHAVCEEVERKLRADIPKLEHVLIHYEPDSHKLTALSAAVDTKELLKKQKGFPVCPRLQGRAWAEARSFFPGKLSRMFVLHGRWQPSSKRRTFA